MLNKTTAQMAKLCIQVVRKYDRLCESLFGGAGEDGISRRNEFVQLIRKLENLTPEEAFNQLYDFYDVHINSGSRLIGLLERALISMITVEYSPFAVVEMHEYAKTIKNDFGFREGKDDQLLMTIKPEKL